MSGVIARLPTTCRFLCCFSAGRKTKKLETVGRSSIFFPVWLVAPDREKNTTRCMCSPIFRFACSTAAESWKIRYFHPFFHRIWPYFTILRQALHAKRKIGLHMHLVVFFSRSGATNRTGKKILDRCPDSNFFVLRPALKQHKKLQVVGSLAIIPLICFRGPRF